MNRPDPLTPEERELARLLGRPTAGAPPSSVDAAVLAAARAAVQPDVIPPPVAAAPAGESARTPLRRPRSRLAPVLGVAASVVFAVGIAWQLNFDDAQTGAAPPAVEAVSEEAASAPAAEAASADVATAPAKAPAPVPAPTAPAPGETRDMPAPMRALSAPAPPPPAAVAAAPANDAFAPPPPPAAAAVPAPAPVMASTEQASDAAASAQERVTLDAIEVTGSKVAPEPTRRVRREALPAAAASAKPAPMATFGGTDATPALTAAVDADALLPRRDWITRIRERRDAGDLDTARASLQRYMQQYPEVRVPRDLRDLLEAN